jgi:hypothetical protein
MCWVPSGVRIQWEKAAVRMPGGYTGLRLGDTRHIGGWLGQDGLVKPDDGLAAFNSHRVDRSGTVGP